ncbi:unnamed protein product [Pedinophyceae sp. YPF-701]|nr:unnamed protein product [Pedinophyceae sp. YPF-701]
MSGAGSRIYGRMTNWVVRSIRDAETGREGTVRLVDAMATTFAPVRGRRILMRQKHRIRTPPSRPPHVEVSHRLGMATVLFPANRVLLPFQVEGLPPITNRPAGRQMLG